MVQVICLSLFWMYYLSLHFSLKHDPKDKPYLHKIYDTLCTCLVEPWPPDFYEVCLCLAVFLDTPPPQPYPLLSWADLDSISLHWWDLASDLMRVFREPFWSRLFRVLDYSGRGGQTFERRTLQIDSFAIHGHETCNSEVIASYLPPFVPFPL